MFCFNRSRNFPRKTRLKALTGKRKFLPAASNGLIEGQSAGGNKTVQMKMIFKRLIPGVQHGDHSKGSLKVGLTKLEQRFTDGFKQKTQANLLVGQDQPVKFMGQGKHPMEVSHRQKLRGFHQCSLKICDFMDFLRGY
jgi:hypothetical protein